MTLEDGEGGVEPGQLCYLVGAEGGGGEAGLGEGSGHSRK